MAAESIAEEGIDLDSEPIDTRQPVDSEVDPVPHSPERQSQHRYCLPATTFSRFCTEQESQIELFAQLAHLVEILANLGDHRFRQGDVFHPRKRHEVVEKRIHLLAKFVDDTQGFSQHSCRDAVGIGTSPEQSDEFVKLLSLVDSY